MGAKKNEKKTANSPKTVSNTKKDDKPWLFKPGQSGNPSGRPKKPKEMIDLAAVAPQKIREMIDDPQTPTKVRADLLRWCYEQVHGKAPQSVDVEATTNNLSTITVEFSGDLKEWSE